MVVAGDGGVDVLQRLHSSSERARTFDAARSVVRVEHGNRFVRKRVAGVDPPSRPLPTVIRSRNGTVGNPRPLCSAKMLGCGGPPATGRICRITIAVLSCAMICTDAGNSTLPLT